LNRGVNTKLNHKPNEERVQPKKTSSSRAEGPGRRRNAISGSRGGTKQEGGGSLPRDRQRALFLNPSYL